MNWSSRKFGDCVRLVSGGTPSKENPEYWNGSIPWASCKDMKVDRLWDTEDHISKAAIGNRTRIVDAGTILIVVRGMILSKEFPVAICQRPMTFNQDLKALELKPGVSRDFMFYWLLANRKQIVGTADEAAHGTKRLQTDRLLALDVNLPEMLVQKAISGIVRAYDDLIENNTRRITILEEMARRLFEEWFVQYRPPGMALDLIQHAELGRVPATWAVQPVESVIDLDPRTRVPKEGMKPFVPMGSLSTTSMIISEIEERSGNSGSKFRNGDTLFARITPCLENGKTGFVDFLSSPDDVAFGSTEFIVLRGRVVSSQFVYLLARSQRFRDHAIKSMSGATGRQRVRNDSLAQFLIAVPPRDIDARFRQVTEPMFAMIKTLHAANQRLRAARDLLLPKLISGEVDVSFTPLPRDLAAE